MGSKNTDVTTLQKLLSLTADGIFGADTDKALREYQTAAGLDSDGICGAKTWKALKTDYTLGNLPKKQDEPQNVMNKCVYFMQTDPKWKDVPYTITGNKSQTIGTSGCGATSAAMVIATYKMPSVTPVEVASWFVKYGFRTKNSGTAYAAFPWVKDKFEFRAYGETKSAATIEKCLANGGLVICNMGKGYWTNGGHYIVVRGFDRNNFFACDPASAKRTQQSKTQFLKELKKAFCFIP